MLGPMESLVIELQTPIGLKLGFSNLGGAFLLGNGSATSVGTWRWDEDARGFVIESPLAIYGLRFRKGAFDYRGIELSFVGAKELFGLGRLLKEGDITPWQRLSADALLASGFGVLFPKGEEVDCEPPIVFREVSMKTFDDIDVPTRIKARRNKEIRTHFYAYVQGFGPLSREKAVHVGIGPFLGSSYGETAVKWALVGEKMVNDPDYVGMPYLVERADGFNWARSRATAVSLDGRASYSGIFVIREPIKL